MSVIKRLFAVLMAVSSLFTVLKYGEPRFTQQPPVEVRQIERADFKMNRYDLIVSPDGNDSFSGRLEQVNSDGTDGPLRTVEAAKSKLKALVNADVLLGEVTVWLRGGTYHIDKELVFDSTDLPGVAYRAYKDEAPVISGAAAVGQNGWNIERVNGVTVWTTAVDFSFGALYDGDKSLPLTRLPESGYFYAKGESLENALYTDETSPWSGEWYLGQRAFMADPADLKGLSRMKNLNDIKVRMLHFWKDEYFEISGYDEQTGLVTFDKPLSMNCREGHKYFLENVFEALNSEHEWYLDKAEGKLYYVPGAKDDIGSTVLYAGAADRLLRIDGVDGIEFEGIEFAHTDYRVLAREGFDEPGFDGYMEHPQAAYSLPAAINVTNASKIVFHGCKFYDIGFTAIKLSRNMQASRVTACVFENIGANAVFIHGDNEENEKTNREIVIENNVIHGYGRNFANAIGVLLVHAKDCSISHNEISDGYYTAISVGWVWGYGFNVTKNIKIMNNRIFDIGQGWLSDMGGIYTLGVQPGTVISGNVISNVAADLNEGGYGGWGIYLDEGSSDILVKNNLVYDCGSNSFHLHYGQSNTVENNIFALSREGEIRISREERDGHTSSVHFKSNIILCDNTPAYMLTKLGCFTDEGNLYFDCTRGKCVLSSWNNTLSRSERIDIAEMKSKGKYNDAVFIDPYFRAAREFDFTIADNSPAIKNGFVPWSCNEAGTQYCIDV